jgi:hypothetical protein
MNDIKKVLFTNGMSNDCMLIVTDAPKKELENFCYKYNEDMENGINNYFDRLKTSYFVKELLDSEVDNIDRELVEVIGYDEVYDLYDYYND